MRLGSTLASGRTEFLVWAPRAESVSVHVVHPRDAVFPLEAAERGYHRGTVEVGPGARYFYRLPGGRERPDPASRFQPEGVHGPSEVVAPIRPEETWAPVRLEDYVVYELHVGTFTRGGTFDAAVERLDALRALGVTAVEVMPIAQFPGERNWGYDGVYPYATQASYGGPHAFRRFVRACHERGLAVVLDVVYNHLGPEGCYLRDFGHYFTERYRTPWGDALNFDGRFSDEVRRFFIENAVEWVRDYGVDALRCDAVHAIVDQSARPFLAELTAAVHGLPGRRAFLIAESDANDVRVLKGEDLGGLGFDAQWSDDFHHALHTVLTGERGGYYAGYGTLEQLGRALRQAFVYTGEFAPHRQRRFGSSPAPFPGRSFVVFAQNHDQVGNRAAGERLAELVSVEAAKLALGTVLVAPFVPLIFMGEEYGARTPFLYFTDHGDRELALAVREGRRAEFRDVMCEREVPDPQALETFTRSVLDHDQLAAAGKGVHELVRELLELRRSLPLDKGAVRVDVAGDVIVLARGDIVFLGNYGSTAAKAPLPAGRKVIDSSDARYGGPGARAVATDGAVELAPHSFVVYRARA